MVFPRSVYGCADERAGNFYTFFNVVRSAANLEYAFISAIGFAYGKVRTLDGLAFCNANLLPRKIFAVILLFRRKFS